MYEEIERILVRPLSSFEYEQLEDLKNNYSEKQIISTYKNSAVKNINYIKKVLKSQKSSPDWIKQKIVNEPIDEETTETFNDFQEFLKEFRDER